MKGSIKSPSKMQPRTREVSIIHEARIFPQLLRLQFSTDLIDRNRSLYKNTIRNPVAMLALKKKKAYEAQVDKLSGARMTLETQLMTIEGATVNLEAINAMRQGAATLQGIHGSMYVLHTTCSSPFLSAHSFIFSIIIHSQGLLIPSTRQWMRSRNRWTLRERSATPSGSPLVTRWTRTNWRPSSPSLRLKTLTTNSKPSTPLRRVYAVRFLPLRAERSGACMEAHAT